MKSRFCGSLSAGLFWVAPQTHCHVAHHSPVQLLSRTCVVSFEPPAPSLSLCATCQLCLGYDTWHTLFSLSHYLSVDCVASIKIDIWNCRRRLRQVIFNVGSGSHFELIFLLLIVRSIKDAITKMPLTDEIVHLVVGLVWGGLYGFELSLFFLFFFPVWLTLIIKL